jgi:hypothetical protein
MLTASIPGGAARMRVEWCQRAEPFTQNGPAPCRRPGPGPREESSWPMQNLPADGGVSGAEVPRSVREGYMLVHNHVRHGPNTPRRR